MSNQMINIGSSANDRSGDPIRTAFDKVNANFTELYNSVANISIDAKEVAQDATAELILNGSHKGLDITYNDTLNKLNMNVIVDGGDASSTY
jgi:hypothetical protein